MSDHVSVSSREHRIPSAAGAASAILFIAIGFWAARNTGWAVAGYAAIVAGGGALGAVIRGFRDLVAHRNPDFIALPLYGGMLSLLCISFCYYFLPLILGAEVALRRLTPEALIWASLAIGLFHDDVWRAMRALFNRELRLLNGRERDQLANLREDNLRLAAELDALRADPSESRDKLLKERTALRRKLAAANRSREHWKAKAQNRTTKAALDQPRRLNVSK